MLAHHRRVEPVEGSGCVVMASPLADSDQPEKPTRYITQPAQMIPSPPQVALSGSDPIPVTFVPEQTRMTVCRPRICSTITPPVPAKGPLAGSLGTLQCVLATSWPPILFTTSQVSHTDLYILLLPAMRLPPLLPSSQSRVAATRLDRSQTGSRSI